MEPDFFPLDEELALLPGHLTPFVHERMVDLAAWMPFEQTRKQMERIFQVQVSEATVRRSAEVAGAAYVDLQAAEVAQIERTLPPAPPGPAKQLLSTDGAMVPLVHGEWTEAKTLVIGDIQPPVLEKGELAVHTQNLSYFSRQAEAPEFTRLALVETHARGVENAKLVAAVSDGAEWEQNFVNHHRSDAVRILDFAHAAEYVAEVGRALWQKDPAAGQAWLKTQLHDLKHKGPDSVLSELETLQQQHPAHAELLAATLAYLTKRQAHIQYPQFAAQGLPLGSGSVESANKIVVEARLKGSGMHWARQHVNPMLALRNIACNDRWEQTWPHTVTHLRSKALQCQRQRRAQRQALTTPKLPLTPVSAPHPLPATPPAIAVSALAAPTVAPLSSPPSVSVQVASPQQPKLPYRPPANHPWRHSPVGKARFQPAPQKK